MSTERVTLPALPYDYNALEPHIDEATMRVHHTGHHAGYAAKTNAVLDSIAAEAGAELADRPIEDLVAHLEDVPEKFRQKLANVAGGFVNHSFFWQVMSAESDKKQPEGALASAIDATFGSFDAFKTQFSETAATVFGSGWAWLYVDKTVDPPVLKVSPSSNQATPANTPGKVPILTLDVWEHAYYLKYQSKRAAYIDAWWNVVNWAEVERRYAAAMEA